MRRPNPWDSRAGLRIGVDESGARGGKSRGRHLHCVCFSCSPGSHFLRVHTKRQRLRPQIGRRRCLALIIARRMRTGGTFPRPMFWRESGERQLMLLLLAGQSIFCASIQKGSAFFHKSGGGAALRFVIARRMRTGGTFPRPRFRWGSGESRRIRRLCRGRRAAGGSHARR